MKNREWGLKRVPRTGLDLFLAVKEFSKEISQFTEITCQGQNREKEVGKRAGESI